MFSKIHSTECINSKGYLRLNVFENIGLYKGEVDFSTAGHPKLLYDNKCCYFPNANSVSQSLLWKFFIEYPWALVFFEAHVRKCETRGWSEDQHLKNIAEVS